MFWSGSDRLENGIVARPREGRSSSSRGLPERRRRALRLAVEALEDRTVLTTMLTVSSLLDDGAAGTLRAAIGQANSGSDTEYVLQFDPAVTGTITLTQGQLTLSNSNVDVAAKTITIDGPGASQLAVSGNNASRVFEIMSGLTATLAGLTITGGQAVDGGGIYNNRGGTVTIADSTISDNSASNSGGSGGGVYNDFGGTVTVTDSTISGNAAAAGGGIFNSGTVTVSSSTIGDNAAAAGGGIHNEGGTVTVTASVLSGNTAAADGGGIYNYFRGTVTVADSTIRDNATNSTGGRGGGIYNIGSVTVVDSTLSGNSSIAGGGGVYNNSGGKVSVSTSTLSGNSATRDGGGIFNNESTITVTDSTISDNSATNFGVGGGISNNGGTATVTNSTISGNSADSGGAINNYSGAVTVTDSILSDNVANNSGGITGVGIGGGGITNYDGTVTVTNSTISGNSATHFGVGGGISNNGGTATVTNSTISGNAAITGGGIYNSRGTVTVTDSTLSDDSADSGGGIYNSRGTVTVTDSTISDNSATNSGGGIYNDKMDGTATVANSTISGNSARYGGGIYNRDGTTTVADSTIRGNSVSNSGSFGGGGVYNSAGKVTVADSTLSGNSSTTYGGGGIYNNSGTVTVTGSTISGNFARVLGGGIFNYSGTVTVSASIVSGNSTDTYGGGIYNSDGTVAITDSTLSDNSAAWDGGGIYNIDGGMVAVSDSIVRGHSATRDGGGIWNSGTVTLTNSTLSGNSAATGGGLYNKDSGGTLRITNSTISDNSATNYLYAGGGIYNNGGTVTLNGSTLRGNSATHSNAGGGGGLYNNNGGTVTITNSTVSGNSSTDSGGGVYNNYGATVTVTGSTFSGNSSTRFGLGGGGIYNRGTATVTHSTLSGNSVIDAGGGVLNDLGGTATVTHSTLSGNSAGYFGGGIYNRGTMIVTDSTLSGNSAAWDGGGIHNDEGTVTVIAATLSGNSAVRYGGGIFNRSFPTVTNPSVATATLSNTIVAGNRGPSGPDLYGIASSQGHNLIGDASDSSGWADSDLKGDAVAPLNPLLGPLQDNGGPTQTMALLPGSPALNAGAAVAGLTTDQRGVARPQGAAFDIGAFESRGFVFTIVSGGDQSTTVGQSFRQPLVLSVSSPFGEPVDGGVIRFTAPGSGASATLSAGSATIFQGMASFSAVANTQAGSYVVTASASGASQPGSFRLTNTPGVPVQVAATSGTSQNTMVTTAFAQPLVVRVLDQYGNPVPGVAVSFAAPGAGPSASFDGATTFIATTDEAGLATVLATANAEAGQYVVTAAVAGLAPPGLFFLTNAPNIPPQIVGLQRFGVHRQPTRLVLSFSEGLDPSRAGNRQNYALIDAGRDGRLGTRDDRSLALRRVVYDPVGAIVTLRPKRLLSLNRRYTLVVRGTPPGGLTDQAGGFLAGDGQPGTDYVTTFGREILSRPARTKRPAQMAGSKAASALKGNVAGRHPTVADRRASRR